MKKFIQKMLVLGLKKFSRNTRILSVTCLALGFGLLTACDGSRISGPPSISFIGSSYSAISGRGSKLLTVRATAGTVSWTIVSGGGSLERTSSGLGAYYTAPNGVSSASTAVVKATLGGSSLSATTNVAIAPFIAPPLYSVVGGVSSSQIQVLISGNDSLGGVNNAVVTLDGTPVTFYPGSISAYKLEGLSLDVSAVHTIRIVVPGGTIEASGRIGDGNICSGVGLSGPATTDSCLTF